MATSKKATEPVVENTAQMNVYQKLLKARAMFMAQNIKPTGKNIQLEFTYFELSDIVPAATAIGNTLGLLFLTTFKDDYAIMTVLNTDKPEETIVFTSPMKEIESKVSSKTGGAITNAVQNLGSSETYQRRYLYYVALDITENDAFDGLMGARLPAGEESAASSQNNTATKTAPPTPAKRAEIKGEITASEGVADELQINALKAALKALMEVDEEQEDFVQQIALKTDGFKTIKKTACEKLINEVNDMLAAYGSTEESEE